MTSCITPAPAGAINLIITLGFYLGICHCFAVGALSSLAVYCARLFTSTNGSAVAGFLSSSVGLFLAGISFGYFIMLPYMLEFLIGFQGPFRPLITINEYFDFILIVLLGLGVIFELPVLIFFRVIRYCDAEVPLEKRPATRF